MTLKYTPPHIALKLTNAFICCVITALEKAYFLKTGIVLIFDEGVIYCSQK